MEYRLIKTDDILNVINFVESFFVDKQHIIDEYSKYDFYIQKNIITYICLDDTKIVAIAILKDLTNIKLLLVDKDYLDKGINTKLIDIIDNVTLKDITINICKNEYDFYYNLGFKADIKQIDESVFMIKKRNYKKRFNNYDEVVNFINNQPNRVYSLDNFKKYMNDFGNPQNLLKTIHIGGTNGKGSTTNYLKEILKNAGYTVASFTSPPLYSRLDIIRINDHFIDEITMVEYANRYVDKWIEYEISMFEIEVFIAIMYFSKNNIDIALFEVGLGGLLDATNIINPLVALNTNIGLDHLEFLGNSYQSIARNKAGIIKEGIDYITGETKIECLNVFEEVCKKNYSQLIRVKEITNLKDNQQTISYSYQGYDVILNNPAVYQANNSALALETSLYLRNKGYFNISDKNIIDGLYNGKWDGRFEIMSNNPLIIIDGAHNKEGIEAMYQCAKKYSDIKIIFSVFKDKDSQSMIKYLLKLTNDITVCSFEHIRAADPKDVVNGFDIKIQPDYKLAIRESFNHDGVVLITGSLYFISLVRAYIIEMKGESTFK